MNIQYKKNKRKDRSFIEDDNSYDYDNSYDNGDLSSRHRTMTLKSGKKRTNSKKKKCIKC